MTDAQLCSLELLMSECRWWFGLELVEQSKGRLHRGLVYNTLDQLETKGWIESRDDPEVDKSSVFIRRQYRILEDGLRALRENEVDTAGLEPQPV